MLSNYFTRQGKIQKWKNRKVKKREIEISKNTPRHIRNKKTDCHYSSNEFAYETFYSYLIQYASIYLSIRGRISFLTGGSFSTSWMWKMSPGKEIPPLSMQKDGGKM